MPQDIHTLEAVDGSKNLRTDRVLDGVLVGVALTTGVNGATAITGLSLPVDASGNALYGVVVSATQAIPFSVGSKTATGFTVTASGTVSSSQTADIFIFA